MKRVFLGMTAIAAAMTAPAVADPGDANLWIGIAESTNGILINEKTGEAWLTGVCLKPLSNAVRSGDVWTSRTAELVSIGRTQIMLDQKFTLDLDASAPTITVESVDRGGPQSFPAVVEPSCQTSSECRALLRAPGC